MDPSIKKYASKAASLKANRPNTVLLDESEAIDALKSSVEKKKTTKSKFKIITEEIEIADKVYTKKTFIPLESKRKKFLRKLNK